MIPILDLTEQYNKLKPQIDKAVIDVMGSGGYIGGPNVKGFEDEFAAYIGAKYAVSLNSGTDALYIALRALNIGPGDEVITTSFTFIATGEAIAMVGATPVFVDIDPDTYNIDVSKIEAQITPKTKALLPVHLYGQPVQMDKIMEIAKKHNLRVIEDCAQSVGSTFNGQKTGTIGDVGCFSFFPSKNLGCFGDGGMLTTNDPAVAEMANIIKSHGSKVRYYHTEMGVNSRLDAIQAAILRIKLPHIDQWNDARREVAYYYNEKLSDIAGTPKEIANVKSVYHQYTIKVNVNRDELQKKMQDEGIQTMIYYPVPLHQQDVYKKTGFRAGPMPVSEELAKKVISLPIFPELDRARQDKVIAALRKLAK